MTQRTTDANSRKLLILYASQTGYALETAQRIQREARLHHFNAELTSMHEFNLVSIIINSATITFRKINCIRLLSHGAGGSSGYYEGNKNTTNREQFWKSLLRRNIRNDALKNLNYGVFGTYF